LLRAPRFIVGASSKQWRNCLSGILLLEEGSSGIIPENLFPETFQKNLPKEFVISGSTPEERHSECFRKKLLPEDIHLLSKEGSSGS